MPFLALPGMALRLFWSLILWLMFRPGGWAVACGLVLVALKL